MLIISSTVTTEQANLTEDVKITESGALQIGTDAAPSAAYSANLQFNGNYQLFLDGRIETYLATANLGVAFCKISGTSTYYDGVVSMGGNAVLSVIAKNSTSYTTASGVTGKNIKFDNGVGANNTITVKSLSGAASTVATGYANATGIYATGVISVDKTLSGKVDVYAQGAGVWGDATADAFYGLGGVNITGWQGNVSVTAKSTSGGTAGNSTASAVSAGSKNSEAKAVISGLTGSATVLATGGTLTGKLTGGANGVAYGVYGATGVEITDFGGKVLVTGNGGRISSAEGIMYAQGRAFGVYSYNGNITMHGAAEAGEIRAIASGGNIQGTDGYTNASDATAYAAAVYTHKDFVGSDLNCTFTARATGGVTTYNGYGKSFADAYGIYTGGAVTLSGSGRFSVSATAGSTGGWAYSGAIAAGISAGTKILNSDVGFSMSVSAAGIEGRTDITADAYGVIAYEGILNSKFTGTITVTATASVSSGAPAMAHAYGIYCKERTFGSATTACEVNSIIVTAKGGDSSSGSTTVDSGAYAIYAGYINLEVHGILNATVNGKKGYAIFIDNTGGYSDRLVMHSKSKMAATAELAGGANKVYIYQDVSGIENIQATNGTIDMFMCFGTTPSGSVMADSTELVNVTNLAYLVDSNAVSASYQVVSGDIGKYKSDVYKVTFGDTVYEVKHGEWTQLADSDRMIRISDETGNLQVAIIAGKNFLGGGMLSGSVFSSEVINSLTGLTLQTVAGAGAVSDGSGSMLGGVDLSFTDCKINALYGGNSNAKGGINIYKDIALKAENSEFNVIFGGGIGKEQQIKGNISISLSSSTVTGAVYGVGAAEMVNDKTSVAIVLTNCTVGGYVYGGSVSVNPVYPVNNVAGSTSVVLNGGNATAQIYGGSRLSASYSCAGVIGNGTKVELLGVTATNYIFGGSMAWAINLSAAATVTTTVENGTLINCENSKLTHELYGGGYAAANGNSAAGVAQGAVSIVNGGTKIVLNESSVINVYGGGYNAGAASIVNGGTAISVLGGVNIGTIYGGGNGTGTADIRSGSVVNGGTAISVDLTGKTKAVVSIGNIYGGGNSYTKVEGGSVISFSGDFYANKLDFKGVLSGNGRNAAVTGERKLAFSGFAGVLEARVRDFDSLEITGNSDVVFARDYDASELDKLNFNFNAGAVKGEYAAFTLANNVGNWSSNLTITISLMADTLETAKRDLMLAENGGLAALDGIKYEIMYENELVFTGALGDGGFTGTDFSLDLALTDNTLQMDLTDSRLATSALLDSAADGLTAERYGVLALV